MGTATHRYPRSPVVAVESLPQPPRQVSSAVSTGAAPQPPGGSPQPLPRVEPPAARFRQSWECLCSRCGDQDPASFTPSKRTLCRTCRRAANAGKPHLRRPQLEREPGPQCQTCWLIHRDVTDGICPLCRIEQARDAAA